jgi:CDP-6-deoxy-D-xylo-4-hexulose-3-dehydrase
MVKDCLHTTIGKNTENKNIKMIELKNIKNLVGNHVAPYIYNSKSFIAGKTPIYYSGPYWDNNEIESAIDCFLNGKWITAGEKVYKFENAFSKKFGVKHSHMVNSGSSANLVLISALKKRFGWQDDDEIIVSPVGFATTISVLYQNRLKPVFVDIEWDTLNFDVKQIEKKITPKTKAIFVSPVLGNPPDMDFLKNIADKYDLKIIGDNCDSLGTKWNGKNLTDYYVAFSNSFYPAHHISTGEGGMICTNDDELKTLFVSYSWWGRDCYCIGSANLLPCGTCGNRFDKWLENYDNTIDHKYVFSNMGYNLKPLDLQGAIGLEQLNKFDEIEEKRKISKETISKIFLDNIEGIRIPSVIDKAEPCWFGTPFICETEGLKHRLVEYLEANKIQTRNYFAGNILLHPGYSFLDDYKNYPEANKVLDRVFFIGAAPHYTDVVFEYVETVIKNFNK